MIALGLLSHRAGLGPLADACYTGMLFVIVLLLRPGVRGWVAAVLAVGLSTAVELFQLTPIPAELSGRFLLARLTLGTAFDPFDLLWYTLGGGAALLVDTAARRLSAIHER